MRFGKIGLIVFMISVVLACFGFGTAYAQVPDLSRWNNTWFSITAKASGWEIEEGSPTILKLSGSSKAFLSIWNVDAGTFEVDLFQLDLGEWEQFVAARCDYLGGITPNSDLDFICHLYGDFQPPYDAILETLIRITSKLDSKTQTLKSAKLTSSGGFFKGHVDEEFPNTLSAGGITITGTWLNLATFCKGNNLTTPPCTSP
jgi:hypothetical protein